MQVRAIYFDLDDTLCGYWSASKYGLRKAFEQHGPRDHSPDDMVRAWATAFRRFSPSVKHGAWYQGYCRSGEPTRTEQMRQTLREVDVDDEAMASALSESYARERNTALKLFPDAVEVLGQLAVGGWRLGLITNGPADVQRQEIATLGIEHYFEWIFIEGELGCGKPEQEVFLKAQEAMSVPASDILFVGNSYAHDILPAIEAGWKTAWIRRPSDVAPSSREETPRPEVLPKGSPTPDATIGNLTELLALLK